MKHVKSRTGFFLQVFLAEFSGSLEQKLSSSLSLSSDCPESTDRRWTRKLPLLPSPLPFPLSPPPLYLFALETRRGRERKGGRVSCRLYFFLSQNTHNPYRSRRGKDGRDNKTRRREEERSEERRRGGRGGGGGCLFLSLASGEDGIITLRENAASVIFLCGITYWVISTYRVGFCKEWLKQLSARILE